MKAIATDETVKQTCDLAESIVGALGQSKLSGGGPVYPVLRLQERAPCDEEQSPTVSGTTPPKRFRDVGSDRAARSNQLHADRPLVSFLPGSDARGNFVGKIRSTAVGENVPMTTGAHAPANPGLWKSAPSTCNLQPATC
jgi:hypothetical protein